MKSYRDLEVYKESKELAAEVHRLSLTLPKFDETIEHLNFLFETLSLKDIDLYKKLHSEYDILSKKINKFIHWVEDNWNDFPDKETGNK